MQEAIKDGESSQEKLTHEQKRRLLEGYPGSIELTNDLLLDLANKHNETLCIPQAAQRHYDGYWYMHMPNGKVSRLDRFGNYTDNRPASTYLVYLSNGETMVSDHGPEGIEVGYAARLEMQSKEQKKEEK